MPNETKISNSLFFSTCTRASKFAAIGSEGKKLNEISVWHRKSDSCIIHGRPEKTVLNPFICMFLSQHESDIVYLPSTFAPVPLASMNTKLFIIHSRVCTAVALNPWSKFPAFCLQLATGFATLNSNRQTLTEKAPLPIFHFTDENEVFLLRA